MGVAVRQLAAGEVRVIKGVGSTAVYRKGLQQCGHGGLTPFGEYQESLGAALGSLATVRNDRFDQS